MRHPRSTRLAAASSGRVIDVLAHLASTHGAPQYTRSAHGPEFVSRPALAWLTDDNIETAHIAPRTPPQNGSDDGFNATFRDECPSVHRFHIRREASVILESWREASNTIRPHQALDDMTPHASIHPFAMTASPAAEAVATQSAGRRTDAGHGEGHRSHRDRIPTSCGRHR